MLEPVSPAIGAGAVSLMDAIASSPATPFVAGVAGGAVIAGLVTALFMREPKVRVPSAEASAGTGRAASGARTAGQRASAHASEDPAPAQPAASVYRPRHMSAEQFERTGNIRVRSAEPPADDTFLSAGHAAGDYEAIAQNYVRRQDWQERRSARSKGVAAVLADRFGIDMMAGVPVIQRADGTVGDVGTSWWERAVGTDAIQRNNGFATPEAADLSIPSVPVGSDNDTSFVMRYADLSGQLTGMFQPEAAAPTRASDASLSIAQRVALVDEGAYPERRTADDLEREDVWEAALAALDEKIETTRATVVFSDTVGGTETLDEPDGMEPPTQFIPFRVPAGHPEVVDTESYIDHILGEELARSSSKAVRRSSRNFLRVIEGGTSKTARVRVRQEQASYVPRHFAMAAEA